MQRLLAKKGEFEKNSRRKIEGEGKKRARKSGRK